MKISLERDGALEVVLEVADVGPSEFAGRRDFEVTATFQDGKVEVVPMKGARPDMGALAWILESVRAIATERERKLLEEEAMRKGAPLLGEVSEADRREGEPRRFGAVRLGGDDAPRNPTEEEASHGDVVVDPGGAAAGGERAAGNADRPEAEADGRGRVQPGLPDLEGGGVHDAGPDAAGGDAAESQAGDAASDEDADAA